MKTYLTTIAAALLLGFVISQPAKADNGLVVKLYPCPPGQTAAIAETLRNEYGVISGVRVAADERTARVIVQAPPDVQARISRRLAAAFPNLEAAAENATSNAVEVRQIQLRHIGADQLETALWNALGNRMTALVEQRPGLRGYRVALSGPGTIAIWIDPAARQVKLEGSAATMDAATRLIHVLDAPQDPAGRNVRLVPFQPAHLASVEKAASMIRTASGEPAVSMPLAALLLQPRPDALAAAGDPPLPNPPPPAPGLAPPANPPARGQKPLEPGDLSRIVNPVQMEVIEGLDLLVLRGSAQDVQQLMEVVRQIERLSAETEPSIDMVAMKHIESETMATLVKALYDEVYLPRQGPVSITPLAMPNALLVVGRVDNVKTVRELVTRLDQPAIPGAQFQVFHLRYATAATAETTIQNSLADRGGLSPSIHITADARSNALIVQAGPRDMAVVADLIHQIDVGKVENGAVNEVRIVRLEHSLAQDIATIMQQAIGISTGGTGAVGGAQPGQGGPQGGQQFPPGGPQGGPQGGQAPGQGQNFQGAAGGRQSPQRSAMLRFLTVDAKGRRLLNSGILTDVHITPDARANALVISSPPDNLDLLEGIVRQLDNLPAAEAQIKVFTIVNGDATSLSDMLKTLFTGQPTTNIQLGGPFPVLQTTTASNETSLVPLRFGVDTRTNSVIASGTMADLSIVEAILTKLDDGEVRHRKSVVIRLKNSPATDVAQTINQFLTTERQLLQQAGPGLTSAFEQIEREVVVVAEPVTNSLVLSATPRYFEEVRGIIEQLDARPPMVMIQVLIASVELGSTNEFGLELGLQDSVLFDRSLLSNLQTTSTTLPNGTTTSTVVSANGSPGFNFNNGNDLGNSGLGTALHPMDVGGQGISNFGTGRTNSTLGYSGLVLSAASENVSALLRALSENHRVDILQRPQIMTLDNQPAFIQVGQRVPRISAVTQNAVTGNTNSIVLDNVGLILGVTPRISPDGLVVMQIDAEKSELESEATGIPIFTSPTGQVIRSPIIDATTAQTTVSAMSEQTVVLGGLITNSETKEHHGVPVLDDIPVVNFFFHYDSTVKEKTELLIIMTPHIVRNQAEAEAIKRTEVAKMSWCLNDVTKIYGEAGLRRRTDQWTDAEVPVIYPDGGPTPAGNQPAAPEAIPAPASQPLGPAAPAPQAPAFAPQPAPQAAPQPAPEMMPTPAPQAPLPQAPLPHEPAPEVAPMPEQPSANEPTAPNPIAAMNRYPTLRQYDYGNPYGATPQAAAIQPANYQIQPWQQGTATQPAVYQAPVASPPPRYQAAQPLIYQQQPSEAVPPAYYAAPTQGAAQR